ncbi:uncharacterized protein LOC126987504 [Eriocheir sinensis]|uniref:uncharacterized protein LOC126987504 n=1 Tax=Eriocheir sinensis TaxID=95602 RepID=UPI0021C8C4E1|nr:uncharacterized protein LOC126987504 [Eriocheir sinensis]
MWVVLSHSAAAEKSQLGGTGRGLNSRRPERGAVTLSIQPPRLRIRIQQVERYRLMTLCTSSNPQLRALMLKLWACRVWGRGWWLAWAAGVAWWVFVAAPTILPSLYCRLDCSSLKAWLDPPSPISPLFLYHLRQSVVLPPQRRPPHPLTSTDLNHPPWLDFGPWRYVESILRLLFQDKSDGVFVEAGAGTGVFRSHTMWLEWRQAWRGLLVEPRPEAFAQLRRRRKAAAALACVSDEGYHKKGQLWSPAGTDDLPPLYRDTALARSTLAKYVIEEDRASGRSSAVQCYTLNALVSAALGRRTRSVDLLLLDTAGGEYRILATLEGLNVAVLVVRHHDEADKVFISGTADSLGLKHLPSVLPGSGFLFFMDTAHKERMNDLNLTNFNP